MVQQINGPQSKSTEVKIPKNTIHFIGPNQAGIISGVLKGPKGTIDGLTDSRWIKTPEDMLHQVLLGTPFAARFLAYL